jgi:thermolabile hemolysin
VPKWFIKWLKRFYCHRIKKENSKLEKKVEHLKSKYYQVFIYLFDSQRFMRRLVEKPFEFGFESSSEACIFSIGGFDLKGNIQTDEEIILKEDPETHLFWDLVHPTTKAHKVVAKEWLKFFS